MLEEQTKTPLKLAHPPIVEAVVDIDCQLPPSFDWKEIEGKAREALRSQYPTMRRQLMQQHSIKQEPSMPLKHEYQVGLSSLQFVTPDGKQLVQFRAAGYSFNRLAPYGGLDEYLPEIKRTWKCFNEIARPVTIGRISLRVINRILLPTVNGKVDLDFYFSIGPRLPQCHNLSFAGFFNQYLAVEPQSDRFVNVTMALQPMDGDRLPIILDIDAYAAVPNAVLDWNEILARINHLRSLKNNVFRGTLTEPCLKLFSNPQ